MEIFLSLERHPEVFSWDTLEFRAWPDGYYYRIAINLSDGSILHAREFFDSRERHYSYHLQNAEGAMLCRWDDAPHHKTIASFPHHRHEGETIHESAPMSLSQVLDFIAERFKKNP